VDDMFALKLAIPMMLISHLSQQVRVLQKLRYCKEEATMPRENVERNRSPRKREP